MYQVCYLQIYLLYIVLICQISSKVKYDQLFPFVYTQPYIYLEHPQKHTKPIQSLYLDNNMVLTS